MNSEIGAACDRLGAHDVAQHERIAVGRLAGAVAVAVDVAGAIEQGRVAIGVVREGFIAEIGDPGRIGRRRQCGSLGAETECDTVEQHVAVDGVVDGLTNVDVLERWVAIADTAGTTVEGELGEPALHADHDLDVVVALELFDGVGTEVVGRVDLTALECGDHRVAIGEHPVHEAIDAVVAGRSSWDS